MAVTESWNHCSLALNGQSLNEDNLTIQTSIIRVCYAQVEDKDSLSTLACLGFFAGCAWSLYSLTSPTVLLEAGQGVCHVQGHSASLLGCKAYVTYIDGAPLLCGMASLPPIIWPCHFHFSTSHRPLLFGIGRGEGCDGDPCTGGAPGSSGKRLTAETGKEN